MSEFREFEELSGEQMQAVDSVCMAFEKALRAGEPVTIERFLESVPDELQRQLFRELLAIELEWLKSSSSDPDIEDYLVRFPDRHDAIQGLLTAERTWTISSERTGRGGGGSFEMSKRADIPAAGGIIDGRYTIIETVGHGGMGTVFLAQQHLPVKRLVAIKFIKGGMDSKAVLARFDIERRALAMMDHPGIARVYDGGQTSGGWPYFVMELVRGVPITRYCDNKRLEVRDRLALFVSVCHAVQHAHLKGIIHRDLKPGNILVSEVDGQPVVKVIDFGVAKAIDQKLTDKSLAATAMIVGTPAYMSPEQADPASNDIDTRTDVYALGVVLYELLVGSPPYLASTLFEMLQMIREADSPRPSTKVKSAVELPAIAASRNLEPNKLAPMLRGELDWIALKALEKDRSRRYETVNGLARDVERYLAGDLVEARPPSNAYRMRKFVTRNRGKVIAASLLFLTLTGGIIGTVWGMLEAQKHAETARQEVIQKEAARENEARERKFAEAIAEFIESDFLALTSLEGRLDYDDEDSAINKDSTLRDLLDRAAAKLDTRTDLDPRTEARLRWIVGRSFRRLGAYQNAIDSFKRSVELNLKVYGPDDLNTLLAQEGLANSLQWNGQHMLARPLLIDVITKKKALLGPGDDQTLMSMKLLATNYRKSGEPARAVALLEETLVGMKLLHGPKDRLTLVNMYEIGQSLINADQPEKATQLLEETLKLQTETLNENHPDINATSNLLGSLYRKSGQFKMAQPLIEQALEWSRENYGPEDQNTIFVASNLANLYRELGQPDLALPLAKQNLELTKKVFGPGHPYVANAITDLAMTYRVLGEHELTLSLFQEALAARIANFGEKHPATLQAMINTAAALDSAGEEESSRKLNEECLALAKEILGDEHSQTIVIKQNLAAGYWSAQQLDRSIPLFEEVVAYWETRSGRNHPQTLMALANLGVNYRDAGRLDEAIPLLEEVWRAVPDNPTLDWTGIELLDACLRAEKPGQGQKLLDDLVASARNRFPAESLKMSSTLALLGKVLLRNNKLKEAEPMLRESMTIRLRLAPELWSTFDTIAVLGESLLEQQKYAEGEALLLAAAEGMKLHAASAPSNSNDRRVLVAKKLIGAARSQDHPDDVAKREAELASLLAELGSN